MIWGWTRENREKKISKALLQEKKKISRGLPEKKNKFQKALPRKKKIKKKI